MFFKQEKKKLSIIVFIVASLIAFVFFVIIMFVFLANIRYTEGVSRGNQGYKKDFNDRYFLNTDYNHQDPYTSKVPNLRDMLAGPIVTDLDPHKGDNNAEISLVLFSDFECSYCAKQEQILKKVMDKYDLQLVWKDYPSNDKDSRSQNAALAARCAQVENAFWDYHDLLFSGEYSLDKEGYMAIAEELHLDTDEFETCLNTRSTARMVYDNMKEADALGIKGVPFLYVNSQELMGDFSQEDLERIIELELE